MDYTIKAFFLEIQSKFTVVINLEIIFLHNAHQFVITLVFSTIKKEGY